MIICDKNNCTMSKSHVNGEISTALTKETVQRIAILSDRMSISLL